MNSGGATGAEDEAHHQSDFATWGLLRIDDRLWLLEDEDDKEAEAERVLPAKAGDSSIGWDLPDWEGCESIFTILEPFIHRKHEKI